MIKNTLKIFDFRAPKIYGNQLKQVWEVLEEYSKKHPRSQCKIVIIDNDSPLDQYNYSNWNEVSGEMLPKYVGFSAGFSDEDGVYHSINLDISSKGAKLTSFNPDEILRGVFEHVKDIISTNERPFKAWLARNMVNITGITVGICFLIFKYEMKLSKLVRVIASVAAIISALAALVGLYYFNNNTLVFLKDEKTVASFWKSNRDLIVQLIAGTMIAVIGFLLGRIK